MSRVETIEGQAGFEVIASSTNIQYNPATGSGTLTFNMSKYLTVDGELRSDIMPSHAGMLTKGLNEIMLRRFLDEVPEINGVNIAIDPVTGADLSNVSVAGVMRIIKAAFDILYNESIAPPVTPPAPSETPVPSETPTPSAGA